jgi:hypothetical protein
MNWIPVDSWVPIHFDFEKKLQPIHLSNAVGWVVLSDDGIVLFAQNIVRKSQQLLDCIAKSPAFNFIVFTFGIPN